MPRKINAEFIKFKHNNFSFKFNESFSHGSFQFDTRNHQVNFLNREQLILRLSFLSTRLVA